MLIKINKTPDLGYSIYFSIVRSRRSVKEFVAFCHERASKGQIIAVQFHNVPLEPKRSDNFTLTQKQLEQLVTGLLPIADNIIFCDRIDIRTGKQDPLQAEHKSAIKKYLKTEKKEKPVRKLIDEIIAENPQETDEGIVLTARNDDYTVTVIDHSYNLIGIEKVAVRLEEVSQ